MKRIRVLSILLIALMIMAMMPGQMIAFADEDTCTITFNSNGGNSVEPQTVAKGEKAVEPKEMQNGDLNLLGWFVNPTIDNLVILAAVLGVTMDEIIVVDTPASKCG